MLALETETVKIHNTSPEERQRQLITASDNYLAGRISLEEFHNLENKYMIDYRAATRDLARTSKPTLFDRVFVHLWGK